MTVTSNEAVAQWVAYLDALPKTVESAPHYWMSKVTVPNSQYTALESLLTKPCEGGYLPGPCEYYTHEDAETWLRDKYRATKGGCNECHEHSGRAIFDLERWLDECPGSEEDRARFQSCLVVVKETDILSEISGE